MRKRKEENPHFRWESLVDLTWNDTNGIFGEISQSSQIKAWIRSLLAQIVFSGQSQSMKIPLGVHGVQELCFCNKCASTWFPGWLKNWQSAWERAEPAATLEQMFEQKMTSNPYLCSSKNIRNSSSRLFFFSLPRCSHRRFNHWFSYILETTVLRYKKSIETNSGTNVWNFLLIYA